MESELNFLETVQKFKRILLQKRFFFLNNRDKRVCRQYSNAKESKRGEKKANFKNDFGQLSR